MVKKIIWSIIGLVLSIVLLIIGGWAFIKLLKEGHVVSNITSYVPWGLGVSWYVYLVWLEVGTLLSFSLLVYIFGVKELKSIKIILYFSGLLILTAAMLTILVDIGRMEKAFDVIFRPTFSSMIAWMVWMHIAYSIVVGLELVASIFSNRGVKGADSIGTVLGWISIPVGIILIGVIGSVFGVVGGLGTWKAGALPLFFLFSSFVVGGALLNIMYIAFSPDKGSDLYSVITYQLGKATLIFMAITVIAGIGLSVVLNESVTKIYFSGAYRGTWAMILGFMVPAIILLIQTVIKVPRSLYLLAAASILILASLWVVPFNIIVGPELIETFPGLAGAFPHERLSFHYTPSGAEWAINMLPLGLALLIFTIGYWFLNIIAPMRPTGEKEV